MEKKIEVKKEVKKEEKAPVNKAHKETMRITNRLVKRYHKRLTPLKKKGFKQEEIKKIFQASIKELQSMVDKIKI